VEKRPWKGAFWVLGIAVLIALSAPCAAAPGGRDGGAGAPACSIASPANGTIVRGNFDVCGTAVKGPLPLDSVQVRVDDGPWRYAIGLDNWTITVDISLLKDGNHTIFARANDMDQSSPVVTINISVLNPGPAVRSGTDLPCMVLSIIIAGLVASLVVAYRARRMI
jgi:ABC-type antimicrobial peptide transport system permease subunit